MTPPAPPERPSWLSPRRVAPGGLAVLLVVAACTSLSAPSSPSPTAASAVHDSAAPPPSGAPVPAPPSEELPPGVVATMSRPTLLRRVLADGGLTRAGAEVLVVYGDGRVEIRDGDAAGSVIAGATLPTPRVAALVAVVAHPWWAGLAPERGTPYPDGPAYTITANHHRVTRYDDPHDEPLVRLAAAQLKAIWHEVDP